MNTAVSTGMSTVPTTARGIGKWIFDRKTAIIMRQIYRSQQIRRRARAKQFDAAVGATHSRISTGESLSYIGRVFDDYLLYGGISKEELRGKRILEIGPGDNLGVALLFVSSGAESVVSMDKFFSKRDTEHQRDIYERLRQTLSHDAQGLFDQAVRLERQAIFDAARVRYLFGHGIEEAVDVLGEVVFDVIVSRAVLEEVYRIDDAFEAMDWLLAPGGRMIHKIDLRDYGIFSRRGLHPLTFLTIPDFVYDLMARDAGNPNRRMIDYYRTKCAQYGYRCDIYVTHVLGRAEELTPHKKTLVRGADYTDNTLQMISQIRPTLLDRFSRLADQDLMVSGIFLVAQKA